MGLTRFETQLCFGLSGAILGKLLNFSVPRSPRLQNGYNSGSETRGVVTRIQQQDVSRCQERRPARNTKCSVENGFRE